MQIAVKQQMEQPFIKIKMFMPLNNFKIIIFEYCFPLFFLIDNYMAGVHDNEHFQHNPLYIV